MTAMRGRAPKPDETVPSVSAVPGRGTEGAPVERHAWDVGGWWDVYFTTAMCGIVVLALVTGPQEWRWLTAALMVTVIVVYYALARSYVTSEGERPRWVGPLTLALALLAPTVPAVVLNPTLTFIMVTLSPLAFMALGSRLAVPVIGVALLLPALLQGLTGQREWDDVGVTFLINGVMLGFALWFGTWFERIVVQSAERYELIEELRRSREEVSRLSQEAGALAEREHLAREMHDTLAQGFTSIITLTQAVESELDSDPATARRHLALMRETAAENLAETRAMVAARQPVRLDDEGLDASIRRICERLGRELGISVTAEVTGPPEELTNNLRICLLRTAQEALANVRRHSGAGNARVALAYTDVGVRLTVEDDGLGFDSARSAHGNGLANMHHRAESVDGVLEIDSTPGRGTTVRLVLPHEETAETEPCSGADTPDGAGRHDRTRTPREETAP
ncbi:two-component sensor histidine kinase [Nocardiopsis terrae]|uniref:Oxygen sensor histidine kinase NreB n=1 Tax=Nocardiopsis terrae TaxID=372655 RepID=A0ABR9HL57_9ACTN|nr:sensor histidine kinase [Nocardiopsis terrae]MBE1459739.1 signal transduction histidine kinase [Nocardiopsis terrae]GHC94213.1 two-component sensor histidine kinase [Nocardiopsis terrae]